ncbi:MAG: cytosine deaminase [Betaproteobacteria bacterium]|nr:cytosine deaminase [Betaproteobacteria bacterium]
MIANLTFLDDDRYRLSEAQVPNSLLPPDLAIGRESTRVDIDIAMGRILALTPSGQSPSAFPVVALEGRQVWPCFVDVHTHLDKGHTWSRAPNPDGSFLGAVKAVAADRVNWTRADLRRRMEFGLAASYAHGTQAIRTHLDSAGNHTAMSWSVFDELRREWKGRIELQATSLVSIEYFREADAARRLADVVAEHGGVLGAVTFATPDLDNLLDRVIRLASERGLNLDFHSDENGDPASDSLERICQGLRRSRFAGRVLCGHACSLAVQAEQQAAATMDAVATLGIAIVSLPLCNLYLQDRSSQAGNAPRTPRWRGVTLLHELRSRGIDVALASDNVRDAFHAYGDHDMLEVFAAGVKIAHLDRPFGDWPDAVTRTPAALMGLDAGASIAEGSRADLVIFSACDISTLLCRRQADRIVLRNGKRIDTRAPDHSALDDR